MSERPVIVWLRNDLRLADQAALRHAAKLGPVLPVFVLDDDTAGERRPGAASRWWLHHSLGALAQALNKKGGCLVLRRGDSLSQISQIAETIDAQALYFCRAYEPWARKLEDRVKKKLGNDMDVRRFPGTLLVEPEIVATKSGEPYKVFTPFWNALRERIVDRSPRRLPRSIVWFEAAVDSDDLDDWNLLPTRPDWAGGLRDTWTPGERAAAKRLRDFLDGVIDSYPNDRNRPDRNGTSMLSAYLRFGEISPGQAWYQVRSAEAGGLIGEKAAWAYLRELGWREFSYHLLYHFPTLQDQNFRPQFDRFPWRRDKAALRAWQRGRTGYPIVDAGMRELWHTGWMHNRVRMVVASFLVKHLLIDWRDGEAWFWNTLVDADPANNTASWQWVAGSGADAAPYFRIFNPILQGEKFDPAGDYVRRWVPEIAGLSNKYLNKPWTAPDKELQKAGLELGKDYPQPVVEHSAAREAALAAYQQTK